MAPRAGVFFARHTTEKVLTGSLYIARKRACIILNVINFTGINLSMNVQVYGGMENMENAFSEEWRQTEGSKEITQSVLGSLTSVQRWKSKRILPKTTRKY